MRPRTRRSSRRTWCQVLLALAGLAVVLGPVSIFTPLQARAAGRDSVVRDVAAVAATKDEGNGALPSQPIFPARGLPIPCAEDVCAAIPGEIYGETWPNPPASNLPAERHPDLNLILRGYAPAATDAKSLVFYNGDTDNKAPQLSGLFGDDRSPQFTALYRVFDWNWSDDCRGDPLKDPEVTLIGAATRPGEILYVPPAGYTIGEGYDVLVLYASPLRITLKYTRDDNVVAGYTVHVENICVEPSLLGVYNNCNNNGRGHLPALKAGQAIGRARGAEIGIAIRDNGVFMDPRSNKDWWQGR